MQALEYLKQLIGILHVKTDSVVANKNNGLTFVSDFADFDDGPFPVAREFQRVGEQIEKYLPQQSAIAGRARKTPHLPVHRPAACLRVEAQNRFGYQLVQVGVRNSQ